VNKVFEQIALIPGLIAGAVVLEDGKLAGWCANSASPPDHLELVGVTCRAILSATRAEQREAHTGVAEFGARTLVFRGGVAALFLAYLDSPVDDAVLSWLFDQINPLLAGEGIILG
jgi:hypothetical protein